LIGFIRHASEHGFIRPQHATLMMSSADPQALLQLLKA
jgi:hypothetical protein